LFFVYFTKAIRKHNNFDRRRNQNIESLEKSTGRTIKNMKGSSRLGGNFFFSSKKGGRRAKKAPK